MAEYRNEKWPVPLTCKIIDGILQDLKTIEQAASSVQRSCDDEEFVKSESNDIEWRASYIQSELETVRNHNDSLRTWGTDLGEKLNDAEDELRGLAAKARAWDAAYEDRKKLRDADPDNPVYKMGMDYLDELLKEANDGE